MVGISLCTMPVDILYFFFAIALRHPASYLIDFHLFCSLWIVIIYYEALLDILDQLQVLNLYRYLLFTWPDLAYQFVFVSTIWICLWEDIDSWHNHINYSRLNTWYTLRALSHRMISCIFICFTVSICNVWSIYHLSFLYQLIDKYHYQSTTLV